jgi:RNA polymerase sigma-70 factor (sigma-E family)
VSDRDQRFAEFVQSMGPRLRRTAYLVCGDWYRADDAVQDALCNLYLAWDRIHRDGNPGGYARRSVVNAALSGARRPWRREVPTAAVGPGGVPAPGDLAADHAARDEVVRGLRGLPPRQRACVVLRYYEDLSVGQTAELLGCSEGTVRSQCAKGLSTLRRAIASSRSTEQIG